MWLSWEISTYEAWRLKITWRVDASSRRLQAETVDEDSMEVDATSRKGKGKGKSGKGKKGGKKGEESHPNKSYGETTTEHSRLEGDCRNCGKYEHKAADCWYKQTTKYQNKDKGTGKSKSKVTEISENDGKKQVEQMRDSGRFRWKTSRNVSTR